jgi:hypothetical protein
MNDPSDIHKNLNSLGSNGGLSDENKKCWACHTDAGAGVPTGHWTKKASCEECHIQNAYSAPLIQNHKPSSQTTAIPGGGVNTTAYCSNCHNNSKLIYDFSVNASVSHYGTGSNLLHPTVNQTPIGRFGAMTSGEASADNKECNNCHNPSNASYGSATLITSAHTPTGTCVQCHMNGNADNLHNGSLSMPVTFACIDCHKTYADRYNAPNLTGTGHNTYPCTSSCHSTSGQFINLSMHNKSLNVNSAPPNTSAVNLNGVSSLSVNAGTPVNVTSSISDGSGLASRVRGAEYYINLDPGVGKGTPMKAVDNIFDAVGGLPEPINATIDTSGMTVGTTYTVYVRGMDIGKQWDATPSIAILTITEPTGFVNGTVKNGTSTGAVIPNVKIISKNATTGIVVKETTTDSNGFYSLSLPAGTYTFVATKDPEFYATTISPVTMTGALTPVTRDIVMTKKPTGTISGKVTS